LGATAFSSTASELVGISGITVAMWDLNQRYHTFANLNVP
jgi:hypothetical protein